MSNYKNLPSLSQYVAKETKKNIPELKKAALAWLIASAKNKISYEIEWLGIPVIQTPQDLVLLQELIFKVQPDYIIETGIAHGGSLIFHASIMELLGKGKVIGVDIDIREHNRKVLEKHPLFQRITLIEGDSVAFEIIEKIKKIIPKNSKVIVFLDSNHTKNHVLKELQLYQQFVTKGSYLVVSDTFTDQMAENNADDKIYLNNGPRSAVTEFLAINQNFEIDKNYNKLFISYSPDGFLRRVK